MDETNWSSDFYSDIFSLGFDNLFNTIDLESLESKENSDTVPEVLNTTNRESERAVLAETTMETNNLPAPDESSFSLTSREQIQETIKEAENKNTVRSTNTWMRVWCSWANSRQINESIETMAPATSLAHQYSNVQSPITRTNDPAVQQFHNCTVNIQNYFGPQSTNQASSSRVECQIGEITSPSIPRRKRKRAYIIDSDED